MNTTQCDFCKRDMEGQKRPYHKECYGEAVSIFVPMSELSDKLKIAVEALVSITQGTAEMHGCWHPLAMEAHAALDKINEVKP